MFQRHTSTFSVALCSVSTYNQTMKIGLDARFYAEAGPGRYVKNIIEHLEKIDQVNEYVVFLRPRGMEEYTPKSKNFKKYLTQAKWYSWAEQTQFLFQVLKQRLDLFYVPHFNIPVLYTGKLVTAIPDIIMHTYSTERGTTLPKPYFALKKFVYKKVLEVALKRSLKIIVPTYDVYNDITKYYPNAPKDKFVVAYEGVDPEFIQQGDETQQVLKRYGLQPQQYLLYVSSMYEHKNVDRLVEAFEVLQKDYNYTGKLILVGKKDKFLDRLNKILIEKNLKSSVLVPGMTAYITDAEIVTLRKSAQLYVFPSLKEGFSLTPLEAQAVGLPCVISDISCHREVFENSVVYFDARSPQDMADKINKVLSNSELREQLISRGYEQVKKYDWINTAKITLQVFNDALKA